MKAINSDITNYSLSHEAEKLQKLAEQWKTTQGISGSPLSKGISEIQRLQKLSEQLKTVQSISNLYFPKYLSRIQRLQEITDKLMIVQPLLKGLNEIQRPQKLAGRGNYIQLPINNFETETINKQQVTERISQATNELKQTGQLSFFTCRTLIISLISLLISIIAAYPALKEIYQDFWDNPITEICGMLTELEKEAIKFVEVNHNNGTPLFKYPNGKKEIGFLLNGTQICLLSEPKGNVKRVKVVYQSENHKQMYGYVERNKLKRLYKKG